MRILLTLVLLAGTAAAQAPAPAQAPSQYQVPAACARPTHERLHATLWLQTAAEYRVLAGQVYQNATAQLRRALRDRRWTADPEQEKRGNYQRLRPAIIMDLDETVLDNSAFEAELAFRCAPYSPELWHEWVLLGRAELVPGALQFLRAAERAGVAIFYITNRTVEEEPATRENLKKLGVPLPTAYDAILSLNERPEWTSDKTPRREFVSRNYRILLNVGDDFNDFVHARIPPVERNQLACRYRDWFGTRWHLLPNSSYGSWERALIKPGTSDDVPVLLSKREWLRGFERAGQPHPFEHMDAFGCDLPGAHPTGQTK